MEKKDNELLDNEEEEEGEQEEQIPQSQLNDNFLNACREDKLQEAQEWLQKGAKFNHEKDGWNGLLWAACNGNEVIVEFLIKQGAAQPYLNNNQMDQSTSEKMVSGAGGDEQPDPFMKPKDAQKVGKYNPLHWASYKGHINVVWMLLKQKLQPLDIDMHGNTSVHHAAANGTKQVLEVFLSQGVDVDSIKNARGHTPLDLATSVETRQLIQKASNTKKCNICKSRFDFMNLRYYCESCTKFYCVNCSHGDWVFEHDKSVDKNRPVCYCKDCKANIVKNENDLKSALATQDFHTLDTVYTQILNHHVDMDVMLLKKAKEMHTKLKHELEIKNFVKSLDYVQDYKIILKAVKTLSEKVEKAQNQGVELDQQLIQDVNKCSSRLNAERNLRKEMELAKVPQSDKEKVAQLHDLIRDAQDKQVAKEYTDKGEVLSKKMEGNIEAREIYVMLHDYPIREDYREEEPGDEKNKKKKEEKKPVKPKKKKKGDTIVIPPWADTLEALEEKVKRINQLIANRDDLQLEDKLIDQTKDELKKMHKEIRVRKMEDEEIRLYEQMLADKKKAKKK